MYMREQHGVKAKACSPCGPPHRTGLLFPSFKKMRETSLSQSAMHIHALTFSSGEVGASRACVHQGRLGPSFFSQGIWSPLYGNCSLHSDGAKLMASEPQLHGQARPVEGARSADMRRFRLGWGLGWFWV